MSKFGSEEFHRVKLELLEIAIKEIPKNYEFINNLLISCDELQRRSSIYKADPFPLEKCSLCNLLIKL